MSCDPSYTPYGYRASSFWTTVEGARATRVPACSRMPSSRAFADDRALLLDVFTDVAERADAPEILELHERTVELARAARGGDEDAVRELSELVASLDLDVAEVLVRSLTRWFQLINLA